MYKHANFIAHMIGLMMLMLMVSIAIKINFYGQFVLWGLFSYIIALEVIDYLRKTCTRRRCRRWPITFIFHNSKIKGDITMFSLKTDQELPFVLGKPVDASGAEAPVEEGSLVIESSDPEIFSIVQDPADPENPYAGLIVAHKAGVANFKATADADLGEGVTTIELEIAGTVLPASATGFAPITFGEPRPKTAAAE